MARYFFHTEDGKCFPDEDGTELPNLDAARRMAVITFAELLREMAGELVREGSFRMIVKDESGLTLFTIDTLMTDAAATAGRRTG